MTLLREELRGQFELLKAIPFPHDSTDDELSDLHADLVLYDDYIARLIDTLVSRQSAIDITHDFGLENRIRSALKTKEGENRLLANQYLRYIMAIRKLVDLATAYTGQLRNTEN